MKKSGTASASPFVEEVRCEICKDRGWLSCDLSLDDPDFGRLQRCDCMAEQDRLERDRRLYRMCQLPTGTEALIFETFSVCPGTKEAHHAVLRLANGNPDMQWLTLIGKHDQGKTHLAIAAVRKWLERGVSACYVLVPEMLDDLRRGIRNGDDSYELRFEFYKNVGLLVLDDLGMENTTPWVQERLDMLVDWRYVRRLPLMVTTNLEMDQLPVRIASRLQRFTDSKVLAIKGTEFRLRKEDKGA